MKKIILIVTWFVLCSIFVSANVDLDVNRVQISVGAELSVYLSVTNSFNREHVFMVNSLVTSEHRDFIPRPEDTTLVVGPGETERVVLYSFPIDETFKKGFYRVGVDVDSRSGTFGFDEVIFEVVEGTEVFDFDIFACKDYNCTEKANVFLVSDEVFVKSSSSVEVEINASLTYNGGRKKKITLPYFLNSKQGSYVVEAVAFKEGYKTEKADLKFAVIEENADFTKKPVRQELPPIPDLEDQLYNNNLLLTILLSVVLVIAIIFLLNFVLRLKEGERALILKLESYILNAKAQGYKNSKIKRVLLRSGWKKEEVERAFKLIKK